MLTKISTLLTDEPVRVYIYSILGSTLGLLALYGLVSNEEAVLWFSAAGALLGVPAVEKARSRVTPQFRHTNETVKE